MHGPTKQEGIQGQPVAGTKYWKPSTNRQKLLSQMLHHLI